MSINRAFKWTGLVLALTIAGGIASAADLKQGAQYVVVSGAAKPSAGQPIKVQEFFWYGCPHCFRLDPLIARWAHGLPKGIAFERVPDSLGRAVGVVDQQAYYIAKVLGILGQTHKALFDAIHVAGEPMGTLREIRSLYVAVSGISPQQFDDASSSIQVKLDVRHADELAERYRINAVPTLIVGGYYKTNGSMAAAGYPSEAEMTSFKRMLKIAKALAIKLQSARSS